MVTGKAPRETELKLDVDPASASRLRADIVALFGPGETRMLHSAYYDTPDQALRAHGITLRIRVGGGPPVQTVKRAGGRQAGLFDRDEWETTLADERPDLASFARTSAGATLSIDPGDLAPAFATEVERIVWLVSTPDAEIELALDTGRASTQNRGERFCELELELKRGEPQRLFEVLGRFSGSGDLRPGVRTKSERGYALLDGPTPRCFKAETVHLDKHMDVAAAFQAVVHACLRHFYLNEPLLLATRAPESLHQSRVALRRLRSAFSLFKPVAADSALEPLRAKLKALSQQLGDARNLDVYLASMAQPLGDESPTGGRPYVAEIRARREQAYDAVIDQLRSPPVRQAMLDLLDWTEAGPWLVDRDPLQEARRTAPIRAFAAAVLDKRSRRVRRRGRNLATLDPEARHRVRIEAKTLRYAAEFFDGLAKSDKARRRHAAFRESLERLQDQLGALNDIETGHAIATTFARGESGTATGLLAAIEANTAQQDRTTALLDAAEHAHRRFAAAKRFWSKWPR